MQQLFITSSVDPLKVGIPNNQSVGIDPMDIAKQPRVNSSKELSYLNKQNPRGSSVKNVLVPENAVNVQNTSEDLLMPGDLVKDRWRITRKLGGGGFGEIYEAVDTKAKLLSTEGFPSHKRFYDTALCSRCSSALEIRQALDNVQSNLADENMMDRADKNGKYVGATDSGIGLNGLSSDLPQQATRVTSAGTTTSGSLSSRRMMLTSTDNFNALSPSNGNGKLISQEITASNTSTPRECIQSQKRRKLCMGCGCSLQPLSNKSNSNRSEINCASHDSGISTDVEASDYRVAIKAESNKQPRQVLRMEVAILRKLQGKPNICQLFGCGKNARFNYMVMTLQGKNLAELRRGLPNTIFSLSSALRLIKQCICALRTLHEVGFIHRDIKPSNFAVQRKHNRKHMGVCVTLLDFGLARPYLVGGPGTEVRNARQVAGFRGTVRYASITAHMHQDLARKDDLWSLVYMLIEFVSNQLPWRRIRDKELVGQMKMAINHKQLAIKAGLPESVVDIWIPHLESLQYKSTPDYDKLIQCLDEWFEVNNIQEDDLYDWESNSPQTKSLEIQTKDKESDEPKLGVLNESNCDQIKQFNLNETNGQQTLKPFISPIHNDFNQIKTPQNPNEPKNSKHFYSITACNTGRTNQCNNHRSLVSELPTQEDPEVAEADDLAAENALIKNLVYVPRYQEDSTNRCQNEVSKINKLQTMGTSYRQKNPPVLKNDQQTNCMISTKEYQETKLTHLSNSIDETSSENLEWQGDSKFNRGHSRASSGNLKKLNQSMDQNLTQGKVKRCVSTRFTNPAQQRCDIQTNIVSTENEYHLDNMQFIAVKANQDWKHEDEAPCSLTGAHIPDLALSTAKMIASHLPPTGSSKNSRAKIHAIIQDLLTKKQNEENYTTGLRNTTSCEYEENRPLSSPPYAQMASDGNATGNEIQKKNVQGKIIGYEKGRLEPAVPGQEMKEHRAYKFGESSSVNIIKSSRLHLSLGQLNIPASDSHQKLMTVARKNTLNWNKGRSECSTSQSVNEQIVPDSGTDRNFDPVTKFRPNEEDLMNNSHTIKPKPLPRKRRSLHSTTNHPNGTSQQINRIISSRNNNSQADCQSNQIHLVNPSRPGTQDEIIHKTLPETSETSHVKSAISNESPNQLYKVVDTKHRLLGPADRSCVKVVELSKENAQENKNRSRSGIRNLSIVQNETPEPVKSTSPISRSKLQKLNNVVHLETKSKLNNNISERSHSYTTVSRAYHSYKPSQYTQGNGKTKTESCDVNNSGTTSTPNRTKLGTTNHLNSTTIIPNVQLRSITKQKDINESSFKEKRIDCRTIICRTDPSADRNLRDLSKSRTVEYREPSVIFHSTISPSPMHSITRTHSQHSLRTEKRFGGTTIFSSQTSLRPGILKKPFTNGQIQTSISTKDHSNIAGKYSSNSNIRVIRSHSAERSSIPLNAYTTSSPRLLSPNPNTSYNHTYNQYYYTISPSSRSDRKADEFCNNNSMFSMQNKPLIRMSQNDRIKSKAILH